MHLLAAVQVAHPKELAPGFGDTPETESETAFPSRLGAAPDHLGEHVAGRPTVDATKDDPKQRAFGLGAVHTQAHPGCRQVAGRAQPRSLIWSDPRIGGVLHHANSAHPALLARRAVRSGAGAFAPPEFERKLAR